MECDGPIAVIRSSGHRLSQAPISALCRASISFSSVWQARNDSNKVLAASRARTRTGSGALDLYCCSTQWSRARIPAIDQINNL